MQEMIIKNVKTAQYRNVNLNQIYDLAIIINLLNFKEVMLLRLT